MFLVESQTTLTVTNEHLPRLCIRLFFVFGVILFYSTQIGTANHLPSSTVLQDAAAAARSNWQCGTWCMVWKHWMHQGAINWFHSVLETGSV